MDENDDFHRLQVLHPSMSYPGDSFSWNFRHHAIIRFFHASPDTLEVDVYLNARKIYSSLRYRTMGEYLFLPPHISRIDILNAGTTKNPILSCQFPLMPSTCCTLALAGTVNRHFLLPITEKPYVQGITCMNLIHLSPDAPPIDFSMKNGRKLITRLPYGRASEYIRVAPGKKGCSISFSGSNDVLLSLPLLKLRKEKACSLFAIGFANGSPDFEVLPFEQR
jgi:hypothetical protein